MSPTDFELQDAQGEKFLFDASYRQNHTSLLFFYRGHW
jgi:peroxiredoxin